jgi:hypothetical protein
MSLSWYPWQLFVRKWEMIAPIAFSVLVSVVLVIWLEVALSRVPQPVFLHYSTDLGVDALGSPHLALLLPGLLLLLTVINGLGGNLLILWRRFVAIVILWSLVPFAMLALWFGILILRVNGA